MALPRLWFLGMTRKAHVMGPMIVCGLHDWGGTPARLIPLVGLGGTQDQARPPLEQDAVRG